MRFLPKTETHGERGTHKAHSDNAVISRGEPQRRSAPHGQPGRRRGCTCSRGRRARGQVDDALSGAAARG
jgi:hypothetical protein